MRLPRKYIPLDVRLKVAERQLGRSWKIAGQSRSERLRLMLLQLFPLAERDGSEIQLDHNPALGNRIIVWSSNNHTYYTYIPDELDPDHLIYRTKHDHHIKTNVRGDGAQYPDRVLMKRERCRAKKTKAALGKSAELSREKIAAEFFNKKRKWPKRKIMAHKLRSTRPS